MSRRIGLIGFLALFVFELASAQDTLVVTKHDFISKINESNWQVVLAKKDYEVARSDLRKSNSLFLPKIGLSYTATTTTNPLMAFGSKLNQSAITSNDFNPDLLNNPDRTDNFATQVEILQPLINIDGIFARQAAGDKMEAMTQKMMRTQQGVELEVSKAYMQLQLAYRSLSVFDRAKKAASTSLALVQDYYAQGMVQLPDVLALEVHLQNIQNQHLEAVYNLKKVSEYLGYLVQDTIANRVYMPADSLSTDLLFDNISPVLSASRSDILAMDYAASAYGKMYKADKLKFLPRLQAFGQYQMYDDAFLEADADGYIVGAQLSWQIFDGYNSIGQARKSKFQYERALAEADEYRAKSLLEIKEATRNLALAKQKVNTQEKSISQYREAYRIRKDRFEAGLEKTNDLLISEVQLFQMELSYLQSVFAYQLTYEYLNFLTK